MHQKLTDFRIVDVTFVGSQAWALGSADCLSGKGTCDAIEYTGNGGRTWRLAPAPRAGIDAPSGGGCTSGCVLHIRFATSRAGYAYGRDTFFMTSDGGTTWTKRQGSADALETLDGNVIRVRTDTPGCPPGCTYYVETSGIGSTSWHRVSLGHPVGVDMTEARSGNESYLLLPPPSTVGTHHVRVPIQGDRLIPATATAPIVKIASHTQTFCRRGVTS